MKRPLLMLIVFCAFGQTAYSQLDFDHDKKVYPVMYPSELCSLVASGKTFLLLDVRTRGEFSDTSQFTSLNIGRLKGGVNFPIDDLDSLKGDLSGWKDKTVVTYCSHSQRSRRAAKLLKENGFKEVYNLNGGLTWFNLHCQDYSCQDLLEHHTPYELLSAKTFMEKAQAKNALLIDLRTPGEFNGTDTMEWYNAGRLKKAVNVPYKTLRSWLKQNDLKGKQVLLYDLDGSQAAWAGKLLDSLQIKCSILPGGLSNYLRYENDAEMMKKNFEPKTPYKLLNAYSCVALLKRNDKINIIDCRSKEEFESTSKETWKNIGYLKNAIHVGTGQDKDVLKQNLPDINAAVLVYGNREAFVTARQLHELGYKNVYLLFGGIWGLVWSQANVEGFDASAYVVRNPAP